MSRIFVTSTGIANGALALLSFDASGDLIGTRGLALAAVAWLSPALRPISACARAYARGRYLRAQGVAARRRRSGWDAQADSAACSWCVRGPGTLGRRGATRRAPPCTGRRCPLDTITRRLLVELNDSGCADRANLPTARSVRRRLGLEFHNPETQQLEIGVTGVARSVGEARRPTRRSYVSSRRGARGRRSCVRTRRPPRAGRHRSARRGRGARRSVPERGRLRRVVRLAQIWRPAARGSPCADYGYRLGAEERLELDLLAVASLGA